MCFEPVKFCFSNRTILEADRGFPLEFAPVASAVESNQSREDADSSACRDGLGLADLAQNLKSHEAEDTAHEILTAQRSFTQPPRAFTFRQRDAQRRAKRGAEAPGQRNGRASAAAKS